MKVVFAILALLLLNTITFCQQYWPKNETYVHVGNIACVSKEHYLDSAKKAYDEAFLEEDIHNSRHLIDIRLTLTGFPFIEEISARLYWDSTFTLYYTGYRNQMDGSICLLDTIFPPPGLSVDSLFQKIVDAGVFTLPYISTEAMRKSWVAISIGKHGELLKDNGISVADGAIYLLTFKVNNCYGQHVFNNPDLYAGYYTDHPFFKRQAAIADAIMGVYNLLHK